MSKDNIGSELFALTLDIVAGMSPADNVGDVLRRLTGSSFFRDGYAPMAFIALCRAEPGQFPEHLALLRGNFTKLHEKTGTKNAYLTARRFAHYVDMSIIANNIERCSFVRDINDLTTDNWLGKALFVGEKASLALQKQRNVFKIARIDRKKKGRFFEVRSVSLDSYYDLDDFLDSCIEANMPDTINKILEELDNLPNKIIGKSNTSANKEYYINQKTKVSDNMRLILVYFDKDTPSTKARHP
ncbi:hypothetical protein MBAV_002622 [Candidatus Magnetobacterium bavaricum]|uniref:Uncharacterized protein n=1 Tax=Candidatus Magnetobacterium bavaricum TaxID=29290 RepID=A0A0F3GTB6_9BACT|nr:hypothetical protein MBAV_002622 [Candidatus Magnetobacterium bavaricum]